MIFPSLYPCQCSLKLIFPQLGEWRAIFLYALLSLGYVDFLHDAAFLERPSLRDMPLVLRRLELVVWQVPSLVGDAIAISFVGFFLGPIFPIVMNHAGNVLPPELISGSISWMASIGAAGAAVFPFVTGAIASGTSINGLQPL